MDNPDFYLSYYTMKPRFFKTIADWRSWLAKNHLSKKEIIVGYYKKDTGMKSITWVESVQQALCFGWIDGIRHSVDDKSYCNRFTPRKPKSNWSAINQKYMKDLIAQNLVSPQGLKVYQERDLNKSEAIDQENKLELSIAYINLFKKNKKAYAWYTKSAPYYKKAVTNWVMSAKQESTRLKRLEELIADAELGLKIKTLRPINKKNEH